MPLTENQVMQARCALEAIRTVRAFGRDPHEHMMDVSRVALALWAIMSGQKEITDAIAMHIDDACAYALATDTIVKPVPVSTGGALIR